LRVVFEAARFRARKNSIVQTQGYLHEHGGVPSTPARELLQLIRDGARDLHGFCGPVGVLSCLIRIKRPTPSFLRRNPRHQHGGSGAQLAANPEGHTAVATRAVRVEKRLPPGGRAHGSRALSGADAVC
jgi:hypothetical protein